MIEHLDTSDWFLSISFHEAARNYQWPLHDQSKHHRKTWHVASMDLAMAREVHHGFAANHCATKALRASRLLSNQYKMGCTVFLSPPAPDRAGIIAQVTLPPKLSLGETPLSNFAWLFFCVGKTVESKVKSGMFHIYVSLTQSIISNHQPVMVGMPCRSADPMAVTWACLISTHSSASKTDTPVGDTEHKCCFCWDVHLACSMMFNVYNYMGLCQNSTP